MQAGHLRHRIRIVDQPQTPIRNQFGEEQLQDVTVAELWASIEPISGREYFTAQQVSADTTHRVKTRFVAGVKPEQSILFGSRRFNIVSAVNVGERGKELEMMAQEVIS